MIAPDNLLSGGLMVHDHDELNVSEFTPMDVANSKRAAIR